jgi:hypothetical protein
MLKKQITSLLFSLLLSSSLACAATEIPKSTSSNKALRALKSTAALMGYTGLATCSGLTFYICAAIASDSRGGLNPLAIIGLVSGSYGMWGGAQGMLCSIKKIADICHEKTGEQAQKNSRAPKACCSGHGPAH